MAWGESRATIIRHTIDRCSGMIAARRLSIGIIGIRRLIESHSHPEICFPTVDDE